MCVLGTELGDAYKGKSVPITTEPVLQHSWVDVFRGRSDWEKVESKNLQELWMEGTGVVSRSGLVIWGSNFLHMRPLLIIPRL